MSLHGREFHHGDLQRIPDNEAEAAILNALLSPYAKASGGAAPEVLAALRAFLVTYKRIAFVPSKVQQFIDMIDFEESAR